MDHPNRTLSAADQQSGADGFPEPGGMVSWSQPGLSFKDVEFPTAATQRARAWIGGGMMTVFLGPLSVFLVVNGIADSMVIAVVVGVLLLTFVAFAAAVALVLHRAAVTIRSEDVEIVTAHRRRTVAWKDVARVEMSGGLRPMPELLLHSGERVKVYRGEMRWASYRAPDGHYRNYVMDQLLAAHQSYLGRQQR
ncbi:hypothetical protein ACQBAR_02145 [Propionibacteriaceae bacterium Y1685]